MPQISGADPTYLLDPPTTWVKPSTTAIWWNAAAGRWDAVLPATSGGNGHRIARGITGTPSYGPVLDTRATVRPDIWWDEADEKLWAVFGHSTASTQATRCYRLTYDPGTDAYSIDSGFPTVITGIVVHSAWGITPNPPRQESPVVIHRTPNGTLWVANTARTGAGSDGSTVAPRVHVSRSTDGGATWSSPINLNSSTDEGATGIGHVTDSGTTKVVVYSTQNSGGGYTVRSIDQAAANISAGNWATETLPAAVGDEESDDHCCVRMTVDGRMIVAYKSEGPSSGDPLIGLHVRHPGGSWTQHTVIEGPDTSPNPTRPSITVGSDGLLHLLYGESAGSQRVMHMTAPLDDLDDWSVPSAVLSGNNFKRGATTPRQVVDDTSGMVVLAARVQGTGNPVTQIWQDVVSIDPAALMPTLGSALEHDAGLPSVVSKSAGFGPAGSVETGRALGLAAVTDVGPAVSLEAGRALTITAGMNVALGPARTVETGRALSITAGSQVTVGAAIETDQGRAVHVGKVAQVGAGFSVEIGRPLAIDVASGLILGPARSTETGRALAGSVVVALGTARTVEAGRPLLVAPVVTLGAATSIESGLPLTILSPITVVLGPARSAERGRPLVITGAEREDWSISLGRPRLPVRVGRPRI